MNILTAAALKAALAQECAGLWPWLLKLSSTEWDPADYLYYNDGNESVTVSGQVYVPFPFRVEGPEEGQGGSQEVSIAIDAVDQTIPIALIGLGLEPLDAELSVAFVPEDGGAGELQWGPMAFKLYAAKGGLSTVMGTLSLQTFRDISCPAKRFTRARAPGLYAPGTAYVGDAGVELEESAVAGGQAGRPGLDVED